MGHVLRGVTHHLRALKPRTVTEFRFELGARVRTVAPNVLGQPVFCGVAREPVFDIFGGGRFLGDVKVGVAVLADDLGNAVTVDELAALAGVNGGCAGRNGR